MVRHRLGVRALSGALLRRPQLLIESVRAFFATRRAGGLAPSPAYLAWRSHTAYGDASPATSNDLIHYLSWRRTMRRLRAGR